MNGQNQAPHPGGKSIVATQNTSQRSAPLRMEAFGVASVEPSLVASGTVFTPACLFNTSVLILQFADIRPAHQTSLPSGLVCATANGNLKVVFLIEHFIKNMN